MAADIFNIYVTFALLSLTTTYFFKNHFCYTFNTFDVHGLGLRRTKYPTNRPRWFLLFCFSILKDKARR